MVRINKITENLGTVDLNVLWDKNLSLLAKGIYVTIMNFKNCSTNVEELYNSSTDSKESIDNAIEELLTHDLIKFTDKNVYSLWSEGYSATGGSATAQFEGIFEGTSFNDACDNWAKTLEQPEYYRPGTDKSRPSYWGCRIFDNETDARKSFG